MMNLHQIERTVIVTIGTRLTLIAIAVANWDKASWAFEQWSGSGALQADIMAGCIEGALVIFTYMLSQRLMGNARRLKSDPVQPTKTLWAFVGFLTLLSAFCNGLYFAHFGALANPLGNIWASGLVGIILGLAAPLLAGGIAYLQGEETATEISLGEAEEKRRRQNEKRRESQKAKKAITEISPKVTEVSAGPQPEVSEEPVQISAKMQQQLAQVVEVYGQDPTTSLGDLAEVLEVGTSRASEIRSLAVKFRLLDRVSAREFSPNGGELSAVISAN